MIIAGGMLRCGDGCVSWCTRSAGKSSSGGDYLKPAQEVHRVHTIGAAHLERGSQAAAHCRPARVAEQTAAITGVELDAAHPGRLAALHAGNGGGDRGRDAAGGTAWAAFHRDACKWVGGQGGHDWGRIGLRLSIVALQRLQATMRRIMRGLTKPKLSHEGCTPGRTSPLRAAEL